MTEKQNKCFTFYGLLCIILSRKIHKKGVKKYVQVINEHDRGKYFKEPYIFRNTSTYRKHTPTTL